MIFGILLERSYYKLRLLWFFVIDIPSCGPVAPLRIKEELMKSGNDMDMTREKFSKIKKLRKK